MGMNPFQEIRNNKINQQNQQQNQDQNTHLKKNGMNLSEIGYVK